MVLKNRILLNDGNSIPAIGLGLGIIHYKASASIVGRIFRRITDKKLDYKYITALRNAIKLGYRLIDTSAAYNNHHIIRMAISGVNRYEIFIQSRVSNAAQFKGNVRDEFLRCLEKLGCDYIDLLQMHWPVPDKFLDTWGEMIRLKEDGYVKSIGVANCNIHHLDAITALNTVLPSVNQIEVHPLFSNKSVIEYCNERNIRVQAYTPLARMDDRILNSGRLIKIAKKYNRSIPQLILRWDYQNGVIPIVKSLNFQRQKENIDIFNFIISEDDMNVIDSININSRRRYDPDNCDFERL